MVKVYPAVLHEENGIWLEFPDLEGCSTAGETVERTIILAEEALGLYLVALLEDGKQLPTPTDIRELHPEDGYVVYISVDADKYRRDTRAVRKMLSIPAWLAKEAEKQNLSLSKVLQEALQERLYAV